MTKAIAADGTVWIDAYVNYTAIQPPRGTPTTDDYRDLSYYDGHFYSDRPPGTALLAVPFYWLGHVAAALSGRQDLDFPLRYVTMLPPLLGAATALALALLVRGLGAGWPAAIATAASGALWTLLLKYATLLYSHITGAACVTGAVGGDPAGRATDALATLAVGPRRRPPRLARSPSAPKSPADRPGRALPALALALGHGRTASDRRRAPPHSHFLFGFACGWLLPVALLLGYDWAVFGRPWHTSSSHTSITSLGREASPRPTSSTLPTCWTACAGCWSVLPDSSPSPPRLRWPSGGSFSSRGGRPHARCCCSAWRW